jgi:hypothetical protein
MRQKKLNLKVGTNKKSRLEINDEHKQIFFGNIEVMRELIMQVSTLFFF